MEFDNSHKVKIGTLTLEEAKGFDRFLLLELDRHKDCITDAQWDMNFGFIQEIWESAIIRHQDDIEAICQLRIKLRELFEL